MKNIVNQQTPLILFVTISIIVWVMAAFIDSIVFSDKNLLSLLIFDIPDMLLFHRILYMLIGLFLTSIYLLNKTLLKLNESESKLKKLNNTKDKLFSIIAHDFKGPFTGFMSMTEILKEDWDDLNKKDIREIGSSMYDASKKLYDYLQNLINWSRLQLDEIILKPRDINLQKIIKSIIEINGLNIFNKNLKFKINIDYNFKAFADYNSAHTILRNIINNAIKYSQRDCVIEISTKNSNNVEYSVVSVRDYGVGMSKEQLENIFKIDHTFSKQGTFGEQGSGIGLAICFEMAEKNNGKIEIESELGRGTEVLIHFHSAKGQ